MEFAGYRIEGELARGGMGVVYRARDASGQEVALKVLQSPSLHAQRRFAREAQALLQLDHPNLVRLRQVGEAQGRAFVAMDLVRGESLEKRLAERGPLAPVVAVRLAAQVARGLGHAHDRRLLHRDVKPANVLLDEAGRARLTDFGLVKDLGADVSQLSRTGSFLGSPGFWPPEQAMGQLSALTPAADVYALGATLYALLTDRPPFVARSMIEAVNQAAHQPPTAPSVLRPGLDPRIERVVLRCLAKDPAARYPDGHALARALEACLHEAPAPRRRPWGLALALSTPAALGLGVAVLWVARGRGSRAAPQPQVAAEHDASPTPPEPAPAAPAAPPTPVQPQLTLEEWLERAREHLKRDEVEQALAAYDEVVALDPQRYDSYSARGTTRFRAGDRAGALADYQRLIELDPEHPSSKMARGLVARLERELREAPEPKPQPTPDPPPPADREEALRHYNALAAKHERAREWEAAEAAYAHLLELEPSRGTTYSQRATMRFKSGNKRGALADYRRFLELYDGDPGLRKPVEDMIRGLEAELGR